jgi:hypothetical protein
MELPSSVSLVGQTDRACGHLRCWPGQVIWDPHGLGLPGAMEAIFSGLG